MKRTSFLALSRFLTLSPKFMIITRQTRISLILVAFVCSLIPSMAKNAKKDITTRYNSVMVQGVGAVLKGGSKTDVDVSQN